MSVAGTSTSAAFVEAQDVGTNEEKKDCDGYRYCENCMNRHCDRFDCGYVCD